jgi:hypothetical protein
MPETRPDARPPFRRTSERFLDYYHFRKPCRSLSANQHGTRFPGVLRDRLQPTLRHRDRQGQPSLPIARGLASWVRRVGARGRIEFNGAEYFISWKLEHQYVIATLSTHHRKIYIRHEGKLIKSIRFPFMGKSHQNSLLSAKQFAMLLRLPLRPLSPCVCQKHNDQSPR